ncbi:MAG: hypothetical protein P8Y94_07460, partial [Acidobacteriota bacterium]
MITVRIAQGQVYLGGILLSGQTLCGIDQGESRIVVTQRVEQEDEISGRSRRGNPGFVLRDVGIGEVSGDDIDTIEDRGSADTRACRDSSISDSETWVGRTLKIGTASLGQGDLQLRACFTIIEAHVQRAAAAVEEIDLHGRCIAGVDEDHGCRELDAARNSIGDLREVKDVLRLHLRDEPVRTRLVSDVHLAVVPPVDGQRHNLGGRQARAEGLPGGLPALPRIGPLENPIVVSSGKERRAAARADPERADRAGTWLHGLSLPGRPSILSACDDRETGDLTCSVKNRA